MIRATAVAILLAMAGTTWAEVEADRLDRAGARLGDITARYDAIVRSLAVAARNGDQSELAARGLDLWRAATADVQSGYLDDRALYWARVAARRVITAVRPSQPLDGFEWTSRGMGDVFFAPSCRFRVLISGFDPFLLDEDITQSNPSGLAALALDGTVIETSSGPAGIQAVLMPVRFGDFDQGRVEAFFEKVLPHSGLDLVVTISMGRPGAFDLERFPGRRRSAIVADNENVLTGATADTPLIPSLGDRLLEGPEFVEFSLPARAMAAVEGRWPVRDNREVTTLERGTFTAGSLAELAGMTAVSGSGGGYLSNEISYRTVLLNRQLGAHVPIGHLHTPRVEGYDRAVAAEILDQIRTILVAGIEALR